VNPAPKQADEASRAIGEQVFVFVKQAAPFHLSAKCDIDRSVKVPELIRVIQCYYDRLFTELFLGLTSIS